MKKSYCILLGLLACLSPVFGQGDADTVISASEQVPAKIVTINTSVGTLKAKLYDDVPNHVRTFIERAKRGEYNGTLFTRVLPEFMIQGGAPDSRNAPAGARCGFGDRNSEIMPEIRPHHFNKRGALAIRKEPWPLPANRTMSTRKRNRICRNSISYKEKSIPAVNWTRWK